MLCFADSLLNFTKQHYRACVYVSSWELNYTSFIVMFTVVQVEHFLVAFVMFLQNTTLTSETL